METKIPGFLEIKTADGRIIARIEDKDFNSEGALIISYTVPKYSAKHEDKKDVRFLRLTNKNKLILN